MRLSQRIVNAFGAVLDRPPKNGRLVFPRKEEGRCPLAMAASAS